MGAPIIRSGKFRTATETMRLIVGVFIGVVFGFFLGVSLPTLSLSKMNLPSSLFPSVDLPYIEYKYSNIQNRPVWDAWDSFRGNRKMSNGLPRPNDTKIWTPTNPRGAERLPPGTVNYESDYYARRLWGQVNEATNPSTLVYCADLRLPPCAAFVEIMAPVFSRDTWRCVWHTLQNDLVHGWGLDFALRNCVEPAHEKIGVVDAQWILHQSVPSLGDQGQAEDGKAPWQGVRERCYQE